MKNTVIQPKSLTYCAFLRGVNVEGTTMKMSDVSEVFRKAGVENVTPVLASGNIIFSTIKPLDRLKFDLEEAMSATFGYEAYLFIRDEEFLRNLIDRNPFDDHPDFQVYAFVSAPMVDVTLMDLFRKSENAENEEAKIIDDTFYWRVPKGMTLKTEFGKVLGNKKLKKDFTSRNMNTFRKILKKM